MSILGGGLPPRSGGDGGAKGSTDLIAITERDFEKEVLRSELPVLIMLTTNRLEVAAILDREAAAVAADMRGKMKFVRVDVDKSPNLVRELRIQEIPTYMIFAEQRIADAQTGPLNKKKLAAFVEPHLPRAAGALKAPELAQLLKEAAVVPVDTREAAAYGRAHLPGAVNIPAEEIEGRLAELHMLAGQPVVYCRSGDKTKDLAAKLAEAGVPVAFLEGGLLAWEAEGLPIKRP
jgi:thioredoxin-like negative regulator of GroEL